MGLRELKRQRLLDAILDETCALIEEVGYESLQVEEVARRLEISKPTFYRYFESKGDVLAEVQVRMTREWTTAVERLVEDGAPFADTLETLARRVAAELLAEPELNRAVYRHAPTVPSPRTREAEDEAGEAMVRMLRAAQERGEVRGDVPADLLALVLDAGIMAVSLSWALDEISSEELEEALVLGVRVSFEGYRAPA